MKKIDIKNIIPLIDKNFLFHHHWQMKGNKVEGEKLFNEMIGRIGEFKFEPKIVYEVFCDSKGIPAFLPAGRHGVGMTASPKRALLAVTVGDKVIKVSEKLKKNGEYKNFFLLYGLSASLAEALTEYGHQKICAELKIPRDQSFRISPGYPAWPDLADQKKIAKILKIEKIGIEVSETNLLIPEFSTTSLILCR